MEFVSKSSGKDQVPLPRVNNDSTPRVVHFPDSTQAPKVQGPGPVTGHDAAVANNLPLPGGKAIGVRDWMIVCPWHRLSSFIELACLYHDACVHAPSEELHVPQWSRLNQWIHFGHHQVGE